MTRKDYESTAAMFSVELKTIEEVFNRPEDAEKLYQRRAAIVRCACGMADIFERDNARFSRALFLKACGVPMASF